MDLIKKSDLKLIEDKKSNNINIDNLIENVIKNKKVTTICGPTCTIY